MGDERFKILRNVSLKNAWSRNQWTFTILRNSTEATSLYFFCKAPYNFYVHIKCYSLIFLFLSLFKVLSSSWFVNVFSYIVTTMGKIVTGHEKRWLHTSRRWLTRFFSLFTTYRKATWAESGNFGSVYKRIGTYICRNIW